MHALTQHYRAAIRVCVPGAGLGRLAFDIAAAGYTCQGNEWSAFMLIAANTILNVYAHHITSHPYHVSLRCSKGGGTHHTVIHPFAHVFCNNMSRSDQVLLYACVRNPLLMPTSVACCCHPRRRSVQFATGRTLLYGGR